MPAALVTGGFLPALGVQPLHGRMLTRPMLPLRLDPARTDSATFDGVVSWIPTRRATTINPAMALRAE